VSFQHAESSQERRGNDLLQNGITLEKMIPGELLYLNMPMHPGSKLDTIPPAAPKNPAMHPGENMGFPGVELSWGPAKDNNWISYYEVWRNGKVIDKVARANFYFDHSAGADPLGKYQVRAVDGAGNSSTWTPVECSKSNVSPQTIILDDQDKAAGQLQYAGKWESLSDKDFAFNHTLNRSCTRGSKFSYKFTGHKILLFARMGPDCGKALINIGVGDSKIDSTSFGEAGYTYAKEIDTYSADDMWDVCVFQQEMARPGEYTFELTVLDSHGWHPVDNYFNEPKANSQANWIYVDGVRVEPKQ
jgi:hypothetical protein